MAALAAELEAGGFAGSVTHFEDVPDLAAALADHAGAGDAVLVKGSRGMRMERVWQALATRERRE